MLPYSEFTYLLLKIVSEENRLLPSESLTVIFLDKAS